MRARPHLHYAPVPGGVYFSSARSQVVIRGWDLLFGVADVCVPLLEIGATENDLVAALGTERSRPAVRYLTTRLREHGMLLDLEHLTVPEPPFDVREQHAEAIALLESLCADPYAAFARLHVATVLVLGPTEATGPAARGLRRAGVGTVLRPESDDGLPRTADAVLLCVDKTIDAHGLAARVEQWRAPGAPLIPVLLDDRLLLAGPALRTEAEHANWISFRDRALTWAAADRLGPAARPVADALAGSLAAQLLFEVLTGVAADGEAHVVHGAELLADRVIVASAPPEPAVSVLGDPEPAVTATVEDIGVLTSRWAGLFASAPGDTFPQLPLALRELRHLHTDPTAVFAWGADQESVTVALALEAVRRTVGQGAAGLSEVHWLLDGALRHLAERSVPLEIVPIAELSPAAARLWQALLAAHDGPCTIRLAHVPGIDWRLGIVESSEGATLGMAWAPDAATAGHDAIGCALASTQAPGIAPLSTDALIQAGPAAICALHKQIAAEVRTCRGRSRRADPVLGLLPVWCGPVEVGRPAW
jgi:hypothetical protein